MSPSSFIVDIRIPTWSVGEKEGHRDHGMRFFVRRRNEGAPGGRIGERLKLRIERRPSLVLLKALRSKGMSCVFKHLLVLILYIQLARE